MSGTVVRRRTWPRRRGTEEVQVHWIAVDDGSTDHIRAFVVRAPLAAGLRQTAPQVQKLVQSRKLLFQLVVVDRKTIKRARPIGAVKISKHGGVPL